MVHEKKSNFSLYSLPTPSNQCEPATFAQAAKLQCWRDAMTSEYNVLLANDTWKLVPPPSTSVNIIGSKCVYIQIEKACGWKY